MHPIFTQQLLDSIDGQRYSINRIVGDGSTLNHPFSFSGGYLSRTHVKVFVGDLADTEGTTFTERTVTDSDFISDNVLRISPTVQPTQVAYIIRDTPRAEPLISVTGTTQFDVRTLTTLAQQAVFSVAEMTDRVSELIVDLANATISLPELNITQATELVGGTIRIATTPEVFSGTNDASAVTPKKLAQVLQSLPLPTPPIGVANGGVSLGEDLASIDFRDGLTATRVGDVARVTADFPDPLDIQWNGSSLGAGVEGVNFGSGLAASRVGNVVNVSNTGATQAPFNVVDESTEVLASGLLNSLKFVGAGVSAAASGNTVTVTVNSGVTYKVDFGVVSGGSAGGATTHSFSTTFTSPPYLLLTPLWPFPTLDVQPAAVAVSVTSTNFQVQVYTTSSGSTTRGNLPVYWLAIGV